MTYFSKWISLFVFVFLSFTQHGIFAQENGAAAQLNQNLSATDISTLRNRLRNLFEDQSIYIHDLIVGRLGNLPDAEVTAVTARLLQNSQRIGDVFSNLYGETEGAMVRDLLNEYVVFIGNYIDGIQHQNQNEMKAAIGLLFVTAERLVNFLRSLNHLIPNAETKFLYGSLLIREISEAKAFSLQGYTTSIEFYDESRDYSRQIANLISTAIEEQFAVNNG